MNKRYLVKLDTQERKELSQLVKKERIAAKKRTHAQVLLLADAGKQGPAWKILDGEKEAKVVALCCGAVPSGYARWTLRLLAERVVELDIVEAVSHETVRRCLKKTS